MPLIKSPTKEAFSQNVSEMIKAGHPRAQSLAAAYRVQRQGRAMGGANWAPPASPNAAPMQQAGGSMNTAQGAYTGQTGGFGGWGGQMGGWGGFAGMMPQGQMPQFGQAMQGFGQMMPQGAPQMASGALPAMMAGQMPGMPPLPPGRAMGGPGWQPSYLNRLGVRNLGNPGAIAGRFGVHNLGRVHAGAIPTAVAGRTDHHPLNVAGGAYVLPADHISSLGQGNTKAGFAVLNHMFGASGPYGGGHDMAMPHGHTAPHAAPGIHFSRPPKVSDRGGARGDGVGEPVPIMAAGGEYVIPPHIVASVGGGDIKRGHAILDRWVMANRKKHIKTLRKLPGPAKS